MKHRIAFAGLRHPHILSLWDMVKSHPNCEIVAVHEGDVATQQSIWSTHSIVVTHQNFDEMLKESECSAVAVGDVYARRGELAIAALKANCHLISDKPLCTNLAQLDQIAHLAGDKGLVIGCQLDLVENPAIRQLKKIVQSGEIGRICTINIGAQHPLRFGSRAGWYFEPGQHGGVINDIGIHIFDLVPWLIGHAWQEFPFAREWNAKATKAPHFKDCAQFYGILDSGAACFADVSYLAPDLLGYQLAQYWRIILHGTAGLAEASYGSPAVTLVRDDDGIPQQQSFNEGPGRTCLDDFLDQISGIEHVDSLTTERVLTASSLALKVQRLAEH